MTIGKPANSIIIFGVITSLFLSSCTTSTVVIPLSIPVEITVIVTSAPKPAYTPRPTSPDIYTSRDEPTPT